TWAPRTPPRPKSQLASQRTATGLAPPDTWVTDAPTIWFGLNAFTPGTEQAALDAFWSRPSRKRLASLTPPDDGRITFAATPVSPFDPTTQFPALEQFSQRVTYRTCRVPHELGGGLTPVAPPFDPTIYEAVYESFAPLPPKRKGFKQHWDFEDFGTP